MVYFTAPALFVMLIAANVAFASRLPFPNRSTVGGNELSLIAMGGGAGTWGGPNETNTVDIISLTTNSRKAGAPLPAPRSMFGSVLVNDTIYMVGGSWQNNFWSYNVPTNTWTQLPDFPTNVAGSTLVEIDGTLVALGGTYTYNPSVGYAWFVNTYELSKGKSGEWKNVGPHPTNKFNSEFPCAVALNGSFYWINGDKIVRSDDKGASWTYYSTSLNIAVNLMTCLPVGSDTIWVIGGRNYFANEDESEVQVYNITSNMVSRLREMPKRRQEHSSVVLPDSGDVLVCGGVVNKADNEGAFTDCTQYSMNDQKWSASKYALDRPRASFGLFVVQTPTAN